jgi:hypothetical protein
MPRKCIDVLKFKQEENKRRIRTLKGKDINRPPGTTKGTKKTVKHKQTTNKDNRIAEVPHKATQRNTNKTKHNTI